MRVLHPWPLLCAVVVDGGGVGGGGGAWCWYVMCTWRRRVQCVCVATLNNVIMRCIVVVVDVLV